MTHTAPMTTQSFFDQWAPSYDDEAQSERMQYGGSERTLSLLRGLLTASHKAVLDLGIGTGLVAEKLARQGLDVYGIDLSSKMLQRCQQKNFAKALTVGNFADGPLPFPDVAFDVITSIGVLDFVLDLPPLLGNVSARTRRGGLFCFSLPTREGNPDYEIVMMDGVPLAKKPLERRGLKICVRGVDDVEQALHQSGFEPLVHERFLGFISVTTGQHVFWDVFVVTK
ncbi:MAG: methyltransferase domain-containing protein [Myxococcota bacterium]